MTGIASGPQVIQIESEVRPLFDGHLMIRMQVSLAAVVAVAELGEHSIGGRVAEIVSAELSDDGGFPPTIDASPAIALEAENTKSAVVRIVSALNAGAAAHVMFTLSRATVPFASTAGSECGTAW